MSALHFGGGIEVDESHVELLPEVAIAASRLPAYEIAFAEAGLDDYRIEKQRIFIPQSKKKTYITALATAELLPAESGQIIGRALNASSPFENRQQREDRIKNARERELAQNISRMKGIEEATVNYDGEERKGIQQKIVFTASVAVRASQNKRLSAQQAQIIREYLAGCIAGLEPEKVYIVDLNRAPDNLGTDFSIQTAPSLPLISNSAGPDIGPLAKNIAQENTSAENTAAGPLTVLGCALAAGCLALWRRQKSSVTTPSDIGLTSKTEYLPVLSQSVDGVPTVERPADLMIPTNEEIFSDEGLENQAQLILPGEPSFQHLIPKHQAGGIELSELMPESQEFSVADNRNESDGDPQPPFQFVSEANPDDLYELLKNETSQIIAIVFSHFETEQSAAVFSRLPDEMQLDVLSRLSDLDDLSEQVIREIEQSLSKRLEALIHRNEKRTAGIRAVGDLLECVNPDTQSSILQGLEKQDADLAERVRTVHQQTENLEKTTPSAVGNRPETGLLDFDDLVLLDGEALCKIFSAVDTRDAVLALSHIGEEVTERVINSMSPKEANRLRKAITNLDETHSHDIAASCASVARVAFRLCQSGRIASPSSPNPIA